MFKKTTLVVAMSMLFALAFTMPASANTDAEETTEIVTTVATTDVAPTTTKAPKEKMSFEELLAHWKMKLAEKRGTTEKPETNEAKETRALGTALKTVDASCIVKLVDTREVAVQNAWATFNTSMADALKTRHTALVAAWGKSDLATRAQDIKAAMKAWHVAHKEMFAKLKTDKKTAWATYKATAKSECKVSVPAEERLTSDATGSISL
jgi:hypothetical protein